MSLLAKCEEIFRDGSIAARNPEELIIHEIGHALSMFAKTDWTTDAGYSKLTTAGTISKSVKQAVQKECGSVNIGSHYANFNEDEWFAEAFTLYCTGRTDNPVMQSFGRQLEKALKGMGK